MAIQLPNPGLGDGQTGDNEFVMWTKVKNNFNNNSHAASRLVGTANGQIPIAENTHKACLGNFSAFPGSGVNLNDLEVGTRTLVNANSTNIPKSAGIFLVETVRSGSTSTVQIAFEWDGAIHTRVFTGDVWKEWSSGYTNRNTTKEAETGYIIASSPVLKVKHDSFEKENEAEQLDIDVQHLETGVYEIKGTSGLRENDGWNLKPPKDVNGNVLCICEATQDGDVITLKTYKKKFDFETVSIVADYEQPTDIPEGAEVMLRFNDLPDEPMPQEV